MSELTDQPFNFAINNSDNKPTGLNFVLNNSDKTVGLKLRGLHPGRLPVLITYKDIIFTDPNSKEYKNNKSKYLVKHDTTMDELLIIIRQNIPIEATDTIFMFVNNSLISGSDLLSIVYTKYKNPDDDCLYVTVIKENTFG